MAVRATIHKKHNTGIVSTVSKRIFIKLQLVMYIEPLHQVLVILISVFLRKKYKKNRKTIKTCTKTLLEKNFKKQKIFQELIYMMMNITNMACNNNTRRL